MGKTENRGIDYGMGQSNMDHKTGIRFGVINQSEVLQAWCDSSEGIYGKPTCPECGYEFKRATNPVKCPSCNYRPKYEDSFLPEDPIAFVYNKGGYELQQSNGDTDIFITKSPYYTFAQFCSPCAPGAGYIMNWMDAANGVKTYCLGPDWFEEQETGKWIDCHYCNGTGERHVNPNEVERLIANGVIVRGQEAECWVCKSNRELGQIGKVKEMVSKAPYPVFEVKTGKVIQGYETLK